MQSINHWWYQKSKLLRFVVSLTIVTILLIGTTILFLSALRVKADDYKWFLIVLCFLSAFFLIISLATDEWKIKEDEKKYNPYWSNLFSNLSIEIAGGILLTVIFGIAIPSQQAEIEKSRMIKILIGRLRNQNIAYVTATVQELSNRGWLYDGSLNGEDLSGANLQDQDLSGARLEKVNLMNANLRNTSLVGASLRQTRIGGAELGRSNLKGADLANVELIDNSNSQGEASAQFDTLTILPDNTFWGLTTDMTRFTDTNNPNFYHHP